MEKQRCRRIGIHTTYFSLYVFWVFKVCFKIMTELFFRMIQQDWKWQTGGTSLWRAVPAPRNWAVKNLDVCRILKAFIRLTFNADFSATDGDFYTFTVCENAAIFAAAVICCAMLALWQNWTGNASTDERSCKNSFIESSSENVNPRWA